MENAKREPLTLLFVCTANEGRSPIAEGLMRARLGRRAFTPAVSVRSAATRAAGVPVSPVVAAAVVPYHVDLTAHCSRQLTTSMIEEADLVVAMAAEHARAAAELSPFSVPRTFLLRELAGECRSQLPRCEDESMAEYLRRIRASEHVPEWHRPDADRRADVQDPYGHPLWFLVETVAEINRLLIALMDGIFPAPRPPAQVMVAGADSSCGERPCDKDWSLQLEREQDESGRDADTPTPRRVALEAPNESSA